MRHRPASPIASGIAIGGGLPLAVFMLWAGVLMHAACFDWGFSIQPAVAARGSSEPESQLLPFLHMTSLSIDSTGMHYNKATAVLVGIFLPLLTMGGGVLLAVWILRTHFLRAIPARRPREHPGGKYPLLVTPRPVRLRVQFSVWALLLLLAAVAVVLGMWRVLQQAEPL